MALFMDVHHITSGVKLSDVASAHAADLATQLATLGSARYRCTGSVPTKR